MQQLDGFTKDMERRLIENFRCLDRDNKFIAYYEVAHLKREQEEKAEREGKIQDFIRQETKNRFRIVNA